MSPDARATARRQLEKRFSTMPDAHVFTRPPKGWVKALREALGMTSAGLAGRMGVAQSRIPALEQAEAKGTITLGSLERAANALDCELVYMLKPRKPLEQIVEEQALKVASLRLTTTRHTMALEAQELERSDDDEQVRRLARTLIEKSGSKLWEAK